MAGVVLSIFFVRVTMRGMERVYEYAVGEDAAGMPVERFLRARGYSRRMLIHLKNTPMGIAVNGEAAYTTRRLAAGEVLSVRVADEGAEKHGGTERHEGTEKLAAVPMELRVLYEDEDMIVIDKAAGVPVHPSQGNHGNTLANGLKWYYESRGEDFVCRAVSRLDKDTTGVVLVAKHMLSAGILHEMARERKIKKTYLALAAGQAPERGVIEAPIARKEGSVIERQVDFQRGEYARTEYETLAYSGEADCSLVRLHLLTGRTHQIRVHMKYAGHPLLGDFLYHPDMRRIGRQALHAWKLELDHPMSGEHLEITAPVPADFLEVMRELHLNI